SGRLVMMVPGNLLSEMTENFMGESNDKLTRELKYGTLKELLNMVCGNALRKLDSGHGFDLGIPEIVDGETIPSELPAAVVDVADAKIAAVLDIQN
ncbi:MAG: chemotaxis protein CheX, partial [Desulfobacteraceae bacterium]|nr:chemotaxis protein CheX [Desulfobacteraceae bacterium]